MTSEQYVKAYLSQDAYLAINKSLIRYLGLIEANLLSLLLDRHTLFTQQEQTKDGWFFCTNQYLQETLHLGRKYVDGALLHLVEAHLVETQRKGVPAKKYYRLSFDAIKEMMTTAVCPESADLIVPAVCTESANLVVPRVQEINNKDINLNSIIERKSKKKEFDLSFVGDAYKEAFSEWLQYKQSIGKPYHTQQSVELCYRHALSFAADDPQQFRRVIEQSIANGWAGLFQLKNNNTYGSTTPSTNPPEEPRKRNYHFSF